MRRSWRIAAIVLFTVALALGGLLGDRLLAVTDETRDSLRLYTELVNVAHERYGAEVSYKDLVYSSVNGMLRALDPHTSFLSPEAYEGMREKQQSSFYGLGILVGVRNGQLTVISPLEGTPGLAPGHPGGRRHQHHRGRAHRPDVPRRGGAASSRARRAPGQDHHRPPRARASRWPCR